MKANLENGLFPDSQKILLWKSRNSHPNHIKAENIFVYAAGRKSNSFNMFGRIWHYELKDNMPFIFYSSASTNLSLEKLQNYLLKFSLHYCIQQLRRRNNLKIRKWRIVFNKALYVHRGKMSATQQYLKNHVNAYLLMCFKAHNTLLSEGV